MSDDDQYIYVWMQIVREFGRAPEESEWYADETCDAATHGYFKEETTEVCKVRRKAYSKADQVDLIRKNVRDMCEKLYPGTARSRVRLCDRKTFEEYQQSLYSFEQEMNEVVR